MHNILKCFVGLASLWLSSCEEKVLSPPQNLTIVSHNVNPTLEWKPPKEIITLPNGTGMFDGYLVTYTVLYRIKVPETYDTYIWKKMPNCTHILEQVCKPQNILEKYHNSYTVFAEAGNWTSSNTSEKKYGVNLFEHQLYPPHFLVSLNGSEAVIDIPEPSHALWSNKLLVDVLYDVIYTVEYWNEYSSSNRSKPLSITESARSTSFVIPLKGQRDVTVCFRMKQSSLLYQEPNWSKPVCVKHDILQTADTFQLEEVPTTIIYSVILCAVLALIVLPVCIVTAVRCHKTINGRVKTDWDEIPKKLKIVLDENTNQFYSTDVGIEYPDQLYENPLESQGSKNVDDKDVEKDSEYLLCHQLPSEDLTLRSKLRTISETTETSSESDMIQPLNGVRDDQKPKVTSRPALTVQVDASLPMCDYVRVPSSPDSGLELPDYF